MQGDDLAWLASTDGSVTIGYGPFTACAEPPADGVAFYRQNFDLLDPLPWRVPARVEHCSADAWAARFDGTPQASCEWTLPEATPFAGVFQEVMDAIRRGVFEKTVPAVVEEGVSHDASVQPLLAAMARQNLPRMSYAWCENGTGFAGATPELLFSLDGKRLRTMALAGTARSEEREVFAVDEKEIREHEYVAQSLVAKLGDIGNVQRRERTILDLGSLVHFLTTIEVDLPQAPTPEALIRRLHPTPALGPLPRTPETLQLLYEWRERLGCPVSFGAPFGVWNRGKFEAVVAIRGVWWHGQQLLLPAGCGVIEASRLVNEWRELRLKREAVKGVLGS